MEAPFCGVVEGALYPPCPQCPYKNSVMLCAQLCGLCLCVRTPVGCAAGAVSSLLRAPTLHSEGLQLQGRHMRRAPSPMRVAHLLHWQGGATVLYTIYICTVGGAVGGMRAPCAPSQPGYAPVHAAQCMVPNSRWWHMGMGVLCTLTTLCCIAVLAHGNEVISSLCWHMAVYARGRLLQAIPGWGAVGAWVVAGRQHSTPPPEGRCSSPGMMQGEASEGQGGGVFFQRLRVLQPPPRASLRYPTPEPAGAQPSRREGCTVATAGGWPCPTPAARLLPGDCGSAAAAAGGGHAPA